MSKTPVYVFGGACVLLCIIYMPTIKRLLGSQNGGYSKWSAWTKCTKSCGGGRRVRSRNCTNPSPSGVGRSCSVLGPRIEFDACNKKPCPIDGKAGDWGEWKSCSKPCGPGEQKRERKCKIMAKFGGKPCPPHLLVQTKQCNLKPCPIDGKYSDWKPYSSCSKTCGQGTKERTRECNNPAPAHGGKKCEGPSKETPTCNEKPCPTPEVKKSGGNKTEEENAKGNKTEENKVKEKKVEGKKDEKKKEEKQIEGKKDEKKKEEKKGEKKKEEKQAEGKKDEKKTEAKKEENKVELKKEEKNMEEKKEEKKLEENKEKKKVEEKKEEKNGKVNKMEATEVKNKKKSTKEENKIEV